MGCRRRRVPAMVAGDIELISFLTIINIYIIKKIIIYIYIYAQHGKVHENFSLITL